MAVSLCLPTTHKLNNPYIQAIDPVLAQVTVKGTGGRELRVAYAAQNLFVFDGLDRSV